MVSFSLGLEERLTQDGKFFWGKVFTGQVGDGFVCVLVNSKVYTVFFRQVSEFLRCVFVTRFISFFADSNYRFSHDNKS